MSVLNYLRLPEAQYIPKYATFDPGTELNIAKTMQAQSDIGEQRYNQLQELQRTQSAGANQQQLAYMNEVMNGLQSDISGEIERGNYRGISSKLPSIASDFVTKIQPIQQDIQKKQEYVTQLEANKNIPLDLKQNLINSVKSNQDLVFNDYQVAPSEWKTIDDLIDVSKHIPTDIREEWGITASGEYGKTNIKSLPPEMIVNRLIPYLAQNSDFINQNMFYYNNMISKEGIVELDGIRYDLSNPEERELVVRKEAVKKLQDDVNAVANLTTTEQRTTTGGSQRTTNRSNTLGGSATQDRAPFDIDLAVYTEDMDYPDTFSQYRTSLQTTGRQLGETRKQIELYSKNNNVVWIQEDGINKLVKADDHTFEVDRRRHEPFLQLIENETALNDRFTRDGKNLSHINNIVLKRFASDNNLDASKLNIDYQNGKETLMYDGKPYYLKQKTENVDKDKDFWFPSFGTPPVDADNNIMPGVGYGPTAYVNIEKSLNNYRTEVLKELSPDNPIKSVSGYTFRDTTTDDQKANKDHADFTRQLKDGFNFTSYSYTSATDGSVITNDGENYIIDGDKVDLFSHKIIPTGYALNDGTGRPFVQAILEYKEGKDGATKQKTITIRGATVDSFVGNQIDKNEMNVHHAMRSFNSYVHDKETFDVNQPIELGLQELSNIGLAHFMGNYDTPQRIIDKATILRTADGRYTANLTDINGNTINAGSAATTEKLYQLISTAVKENAVGTLTSGTYDPNLSANQNLVLSKIENRQNAYEVSNLIKWEGFDNNQGYAYLVYDGNTTNIKDTSGVTIGSGVDLGQQSKEELQSWLNPEIYNKIEPVIGLKREEAAEAFKSMPKNLGLTPNEAAEVSAVVIDKYLTRLKSVVPNFDTLPSPARSILLSVFYHYGGSSKLYSDINRMITSGDYSAAVDRLKKNTDYKERFQSMSQELAPLAAR